MFTRMIARPSRSRSFVSVALLLAALSLTTPAGAQTAAQPADAKAQATKALEVLKLGETAKDVAFEPLDGEEKVKLSELTKEGPLVLVLLRGFPGYQCPICSRQVGELRRSAEEFAKHGAKVVLVYPGPGPAENLKQKAREFLADRELPKPFVMMVDPEYALTNLYELRWNGPQETSFPSTFVLDTKRVVKFRKVSVTHGDRAATEDILATLVKLQSDTTGASGAASQAESGK